MWFDKEKIQWPVLSNEDLIKRLNLPEGKIDMVLDTSSRSPTVCCLPSA